MKRLLLLLLIYIVPLVATSRTIYVVSVGICNYTYANDLTKAENDASAFAELYKTHTYHVTTLIGREATNANILGSLKSVLSHATKEDIVVFFFSGHGTSYGICGSDTKSAKDGISFASIQKILRDCPAENKQLYIDACHSGGFRSSKKSSHSYSSMNSTEGVMLFLSCRNGETSLERASDKNGYFTTYLLSGLKGAADSDNDRIVEAKELFNYVSTNVSKVSRKQQNPVMWGKFSDNMHLMNWNKAK